MKKELIFLFCLLMVLAPCTPYAAEYSLNDLYEIALEKSDSIKIAEEELYISKRVKEKANAVLIPTISAFGTHTRYTEEKRSGSTLIQPNHTNEWGIRLDQSFSLSGKEFKAYKIAKDQIKKSRSDLYAIKEAYLINVAFAYYDVLKLRKATRIATANVNRLKKHRDASKIRLEVGAATKTVLLRAEAELSGSQSDLIKAKNLLRLARSVLARTAGITGNYELKEPQHGETFHEPDRDISDVKSLTGDCKLPPLDCLKEKALSENAEIKTMIIQKEITKKMVTITKGTYWPDLSIEGVYYMQDSSPSRTFSSDESVYGAVKLNFPFFEGGLKKAEVREAKARLRQAENTLSDLKQSINIEVENAYLELLTFSGVINHLRAEEEYSIDNFNAVTKQFQYGLANSIDVIDANTLLVTSETELVKAEYDYLLAVLKLKKAAGILLKTISSPK